MYFRVPLEGGRHELATKCQAQPELAPIVSFGGAVTQKGNIPALTVQRGLPICAALCESVAEEASNKSEGQERIIPDDSYYLVTADGWGWGRPFITTMAQ